MGLKTATLITIIGLTISTLMDFAVRLGLVVIRDFDSSRLYFSISLLLFSLPLINFFVSLYRNQK